MIDKMKDETWMMLDGRVLCQQMCCHHNTYYIFAQRNADRHFTFDNTECYAARVVLQAGISGVTLRCGNRV